MPKKILIVSSSFYPMNSPRSSRTTELAKEMSRQGHEVTVLTPKIPEHSDFEKKYELTIKNLGKQTWKPAELKGSSVSLLLRRAINRFSNLLLEYPDIQLMGMVEKALKKEEQNYDLLISIAVPHAIHWGVAKVWKKGSDQNPAKVWVSDCGDPYMGNPLRKKFFYFKYMEKWFCRKADYLTVPVKEAIKGYYKEFHHKIKVIPQGFNIDSIDYKRQYKGNRVPTFVYAGVFYKDIRDPKTFLDYLATLDVDFKFIIYTKKKKLVTPYEKRLKGKLIVKDYIPREDLLLQMSQADFLINFENNTSIQSPSKLIDYALVGRPVLSINSNGILDIELINQFLNGDYSNALQVGNIEQYDIKNVAKEFIKLI